MKKNGILDTCLRDLKNWPNACGVAVEYPVFAQFKNNLTDAKLVLWETFLSKTTTADECTDIFMTAMVN